MLVSTSAFFIKSSILELTQLVQEARGWTYEKKTSEPAKGKHEENNIGQSGGGLKSQAPNACAGSDGRGEAWLKGVKRAQEHGHGVESHEVRHPTKSLLPRSISAYPKAMPPPPTLAR